MERLIVKLKLLLLARPHLFRSSPETISFLRHLSYHDIKKATDSFRRTIDNSSHEAGYKAKFRDGRLALVKEIRDLDEEEAFCTEVKLLARLHHRNIVSLNGFSTGHKRFLVFENVENGSLKEHLSDPLKSPLNWRTRLQIVIGVAAALEYLYFFCDPPVYNISVSSSTILLDENYNPKLSDIGFVSSRGKQVVKPDSSGSTECGGEVVCTRNNITYQLGLLILEVITGQCSVAEDGGADLIQWIQGSSLSISMHNMLDPDLGNSYDSRELKGLVAVAKLCIKQHVEKKPTTVFTPQIFRYLQRKVALV